jgi:hypothetical protein
MAVVHSKYFRTFSTADVVHITMARRSSFQPAVLSVFFLFIILQPRLQAQSEWMWLEGSNQLGQSGAFGTLGIPSSSNVPSARADVSMWVGKDGKRWFFGGSGYDSVGTGGALNDLWQFNASTLEWAWMGGSKTVPKVSGSILGQPGVYGTLGVSAAANIPGGRSEASSWTDASGNLWLFGGAGFDSQGNQGPLNDLWLYSPSEGQWTWMGGSSTNNCSSQSSPPCGQLGVYGTQGVPAIANIPGGREGASCWIDASGKFWLFGGYAGFNSANGYSTLLWMNDLWMFDPSTREWAWIGGSDVANQAGVYGTLGVAAAGNIPGARADATVSVDSSGNVWLFGGTGDADSGLDAYGDNLVLNDLWVFSLATTEWTWMSGNSTATADTRDGFYPLIGPLGVFSANNLPGSLDDANSWIDASGNFWLFGGGAWFYESPPFNMIWEFEASTKEWALMGAASAGYAGMYGIQGVPASSNVPGGRLGASLWFDGNGNLWLFGGWGCDATPNCPPDALNDLWAFGSNLNLQVTPTVVVAPSQSSVGLGQSFPVVITVAGGPVPTGSVTLVGGGFTSSPTAQSQGTATITVPAGALSIGSATLTATYTPDTTGSVVYQGASGMASVTVVTSTYSLSGTTARAVPGVPP